MDKITPEQFVKQFELTDDPKIVKSECLPVTLWIPKDLKEKYDKIQKRSGLRFGKFLKEVVIKAIESVNIAAG